MTDRVAELEARAVEFADVYERARGALASSTGDARARLQAEVAKHEWLYRLITGQGGALTAFLSSGLGGCDCERAESGLGILPAAVGGAALWTAVRAFGVRLLTAGGAYAIARAIAVIAAAIAGLRAALPASPLSGDWLYETAPDGSQRVKPLVLVAGAGLGVLLLARVLSS